MASFDLPELPQTPMSPQMLMGAASPLWCYFGAAAASGVAYWWMTRWTQPQNLEAFFGAATRASALSDAGEAAVASGITGGTIAPAGPVGGESAPIGPFVEAAPMPEAPIDQTMPEPGPDLSTDLAPRSRMRRSPSAEGEG